jgi:hypothetical protein
MTLMERIKSRRLFRTLSQLLLPALAAVALLCIPDQAQAQFFGGLYGSQVYTVPIIGTNALFASPWNLTNAAAYTATNAAGQYSGIEVKNGHSIAFQLTSAGSNTTSSAVSAVFFASLDNITFDTSTPYVLTLTLVNTAQVAASTNWDIGAKGYIALAYLTNANAFFATNTTLRYALKPGY